jgi:hypothetical protein
MDIGRAFKPDQARYFRPFPEEYILAGQLIERCGDTVPILHSEYDWLFKNWCELHQDDAGTLAGLVGSRDFHVIFQHATRDVQNAVEDVIDRHLSELTTILDPIDEIASCDDAWDMIQVGLEDRTERIRQEGEDVKVLYEIAESFERRAELEVAELRRKISLASQYTALELVDPAIDVSRDLTIVNRLNRERMFTNGHILRLKVNFVLKTDKQHLLYPGFPITFGTPTYGALPQDAQVKTIPYTVRVVVDEDNGTTFLVQTKSRPKARDVSIIKLSRGRQLQDRRGVRHLIVAVKDTHGWRVATRDDAEEYRRIARKNLWAHELQEGPDTSPPNPDSSSTYWSLKIMGRLVRESRRRKNVIVAPSVEHQITIIEVDIADRYAIDGTGHADYRKRIITKYIRDAWFSWHLKNGNGSSP